MKAAISEDKKEVLADKLRKLEDVISKLYNALEEDETLPDAKFNEYEKYIEDLNSIHTDLLDEVTLYS